MRNKINQMVHGYEGNPLSVTYKWCMIVAIIAIQRVGARKVAA